MKKIFVLFIFAFSSVAAFSQDKGKDYVTMKADGRVYWIRSGKPIKMAIDVPLKNGSVVNMKGEITSKEGTVTQLEKGDRMLMDGTMAKKK